MLAYDKKLHLICGFLIAIAGSHFDSVIFGFLMSLIAGLAKETYDLWDYGGFDWHDMVATWAGGLAGCVLMEAARWIF